MSLIETLGRAAQEMDITPRRFRDSVLGTLLGWFSLKWFGVVDTMALALA